MNANFQCTIATPLGSVFAASVKRATLLTEAGEITVLANHEPLVALARPGIATFELEGIGEKTFMLEKGIVEIRHDGTLLLLVEGAEEK